MFSKRDSSKICHAGSLEIVSQMVASAEKTDSSAQLLRRFIACRVFAANLFLRVMGLLFFKNRRYPPRVFRKIIVYTVGILGDNVVMLPALAALRKYYPEAKITVISTCQEWDPGAAVELLEPSPFLDHLMIVRDFDCPVQRHGARFEIISPELRDITCDLFVNLSPFGNRGWLGAVIREMIFAKLTGAKQAVGFRVSTFNWRGKFNRIQHHFVKNEPRRYQEVLRQMGIQTLCCENALPENTLVSQEIIARLRADGWRGRPLYVINAGAKFDVKRWPAKLFGLFAHQVSERFGAAVVLTGVASERALAEQIADICSGQVFNLAGETTLQELIEVLRLARGCITNDTGTMHVAAMAGVPTVALFSTRFSPTHWFPLGPKIIALFRFMDCSFCYKDQCSSKGCLKSISVDDVMEALERLNLMLTEIPRGVQKKISLV